jgi:hypothetical protein
MQRKILLAFAATTLLGGATLASEASASPGVSTGSAINRQARTAIAAAQNNPDRSSRPPTDASQTTGQRDARDEPRMQAPIGHRQPRPSDLPQGLDQNIIRRSLEDRELDRKMRICRDC